VTGELEPDDLEQELCRVKMHLARLREAETLKAEAAIKAQRASERTALIEGRFVPACPSGPKGNPCDVCLRGVLDLTGHQCRSKH
jgi:hypothetical protein